MSHILIWSLDSPEIEVNPSNPFMCFVAGQDDDVGLEEPNQEEDENNSQGKCDDIGTEQNKHEDIVNENKDKEDDKGTEPFLHPSIPVTA